MGKPVPAARAFGRRCDGRFQALVAPPARPCEAGWLRLDPALRSPRPTGLRSCLERWLSGRKHRTRNAAYPQGYRGFESHPLRHQLRMSVKTTAYGRPPSESDAVCVAPNRGRSRPHDPTFDNPSLTFGRRRLHLTMIAGGFDAKLALRGYVPPGSPDHFVWWVNEADAKTSDRTGCRGC